MLHYPVVVMSPTKSAKDAAAKRQEQVRAWLKELREFNAEPFMLEGRNQPPMPIRDIFNEEKRSEE